VRTVFLGTVAGGISQSIRERRPRFPGRGATVRNGHVAMWICTTGSHTVYHPLTAYLDFRMAEVGDRMYEAIDRVLSAASAPPSSRANGHVARTVSWRKFAEPADPALDDPAASIEPQPPLVPCSDPRK